MDEKPCFNCLSKKHQVKDCISEFKCCHDSCEKKHHILLHENKKPVPTHVSNPSFLVNLKSNFSTIVQSNHPTDTENEDSNQSMLVTNIKIKTPKSKFLPLILQVLPVTMSNGNKPVKDNTVLDSRPDSSILEKNHCRFSSS